MSEGVDARQESDLSRQSSCHRSMSQHFNSSRWLVIPALRQRANITPAIFQNTCHDHNTNTHTHGGVCPPASQPLTCSPPRLGLPRQSPHPPPPPLRRRPPARAGKVERTPRRARRGSTRTPCRGTCRCHRAAACRSCAAPWSSWHRPDREEQASKR